MAALAVLAAIYLAGPVLAFASSISFEPITLPTTPADVDFYYKATTTAYIDGKSVNILFRPLVESGKSYPSFTNGQTWAVGTHLDVDGTVLTATDNALFAPSLAIDFDRCSIFVKFGKIWLVMQNEATPGGFYLCELTQARDGVLTPVKCQTVNMGSAFGTARPCAGYLTPWFSHLGAEEFVVDGKNYPPVLEIEGFAAFARQLKLVPDWRNVNPYWYGYPVEIAVTSKTGTYSVKKRYSMGRANWETSVTLADRKTVLMADDDSSGGILALFIADKAGDLSSGKLYCALPTQLSATDGGSFSLAWVPLNPDKKSVKESVVYDAIKGVSFNASATKFEDLFEIATVVYNVGSTSVPNVTAIPEGFKEVRVGSSYEWLKLKPTMGALASCMETRRMCAYEGGSTEWTKAEGITYDKVKNVAYLGLTSIRRPMTNNHANDVGGPNAIRLPQNEAGAVYRFTLKPVKGLSLFTPVGMRGIIEGFGAGASNTVNFSVPVTSIASPDNVAIMPEYQTLIIGEDCTNQHPNNVMWAHDLTTGALTPILYSPYDAEVTSPYYFAKILKFSYLTAAIQHPRPQDMPATFGYWVLPNNKGNKQNYY